ncbi:MAG: hypothetical protein ACR2M1_08285 [Gemmatimonadaceae bacterium]
MKGGVALELRLPGRARATDDLDIIVVCDEEDLVTALDTALSAASDSTWGTASSESYLGCTFTRRPDVHPLGDKGVRVWIQISYRSQRWATVQAERIPPGRRCRIRRGGVVVSHCPA